MRGSNIQQSEHGKHQIPNGIHLKILNWIKFGIGFRAQWLNHKINALFSGALLLNANRCILTKQNVVSTVQSQIGAHAHTPKLRQNGHA